DCTIAGAEALSMALAVDPPDLFKPDATACGKSKCGNGIP
ncbi:unnamed protein product, partial [marine sediment metagenome]